MSRRIIVIGAGIGGLTLADGPHAAGVPARDIVRFHDHELRRLAVVDHDAATAASAVLHRRAVGRLALRDALLAGLQTAEEPIVHWGHTFDYCERLDDGRIRVSFTDGSTATGDLLVAADGSNSRVRRHDLPDLNRVKLGVLNIAGRHPLTADQRVAGLPMETLDTSVNCEAGMRVYANQALKLATRNAQSAASESRLPRMGFSTALRVANAVPPVNRAMFGNPSAEPASAVQV